MLRYMLDTHICIYVMKRSPVSLADKFTALNSELCISVITLCELFYGAEKSTRRKRNLDALDEFTSHIDVLPFTKKAAEHYGDIRARLEEAGQICGAHDMEVGGHARSQDLTVVTNNMREFARMPGVMAENWV